MDMRHPAGMALSCPTCGPDESRTRYSTRSGFPLVRCASCGLVFLERLGDSVNDMFYADAGTSAPAQAKSKDAIEYWSFPAMYDRHQRVFDGFFAERWQRLNAHRPGIRSVLDIGCGYGFFLQHLAGRGLRLEGIEIDAAVADHARQQFGLNISETPIEEYSASETFDCIVMCDVLEHLDDPKGALERCRRLLSPGGVMLVQVPNLVGMRFPLGHTWGLPHHIWQFGPRNLASLIQASGMDIARWYTGSLGVIGVYERGGPKLRDRFGWAVARHLRLGNRLIMIARNPASGSGHQA